MCVHRNTIMADSSDPTVPTIPTILPSRSMRESKHARSPRWDMSRRLKAILARLNFRHNYLCSVLFPSLSTLSFSVSKSHPKGSPCLTMRLTIKPLSRYTSTSPLSPFHLVLIGCFLGRVRGLPHLPHAMLGTPQERSRRH